jgi:hypothetical protein
MCEAPASLDHSGSLCEFKPSVGTKVKHYRAYSRAKDDAGNWEATFQTGRNSNKFEVKKS